MVKDPRLSQHIPPNQCPVKLREWLGDDSKVVAHTSFKSRPQFLPAKPYAVIPQEVFEWAERLLTPVIGLYIYQRTVDIKEDTSDFHVRSGGSG